MRVLISLPLPSVCATLSGVSIFFLSYHPRSPQYIVREGVEDVYFKYTYLFLLWPHYITLKMGVLHKRFSLHLFSCVKMIKGHVYLVEYNWNTVRVRNKPEVWDLPSALVRSAHAIGSYYICLSNTNQITLKWPLRTVVDGYYAINFWGELQVWFLLKSVSSFILKGVKSATPNLYHLSTFVLLSWFYIMVQYQ